MAAAPGGGVPSSSANALFVPEGSPDRPILQEAPR